MYSLSLPVVAEHVLPVIIPRLSDFHKLLTRRPQVSQWLVSLHVLYMVVSTSSHWRVSTTDPPIFYCGFELENLLFEYCVVLCQSNLLILNCSAVGSLFNVGWLDVCQVV